MPPASQSRSALVNPELLERLQAWSLDQPEGKVGFARKLAQENGWSAPYATRVVAEYRRFLYLAVTAGHPVCPSDPVDQAWHQHLLETRSYWQEFCPKVLGEPLHHTPSRGGTKEQQRMREWYGRTLASYQAAFGTAAPTDLWPPSHLRFSGAERWMRVDAGRLWLLPRPCLVDLHRRKQRGGLAPWLGQGGLLAVLALGVSGCGAKALPFPHSLSGPEFLLLYGLLTGVSLLAVLALSDWKDEARARLFGGLAMGAVWVLGLTRLIHGLAAGRPVLFLIVTLYFVTAALFLIVFTDQWIGGGRGGLRRNGASGSDKGGSAGGSDAGAGGCGGGGCGGCGGGGGCGG
jgi:hypothetical protein